MKKNWKRLIFWLVACVLLTILLFAGRANANDNTSVWFYWSYVVFIDRPIELSDWDSVEELQDFLDNTVVRLIVVSGEPLNGQCENKAFQLRDYAEERGKRLETEILTKAECLKYHAHLKYSSGRYLLMDDNDGHYICKAVIRNEVWFIEPANDNIWLTYKLD